MVKKEYAYTVLEGSAFEVGRQQALRLKERKPRETQFFCSPHGPRRGYLERAAELLNTYERFCPGLNEEIAGFAQGMGCRPEEVVYYTFSIGKMGFCSHFSISPERSMDGNCYVGRNYEWSFEDDMQLVHTRIPGRYAHTGFSVLFMGRLDGMNETGLTVTMSAGNPSPEGAPEEKGFMFWVLIRRILDSCATVDEALHIARSFPLSFHVNIIVTEASGKSVLIEKTPHAQGEQLSHGVIFSTNHFTLEETSPPELRRMRNSLIRHDVIRERLSVDSINTEQMSQLLETPYPEGLCFEHFSDYMGTLWSILYNVTEKRMEVCFGPPNHGENRRISFSPLVKGKSEIIQVQCSDLPADPAMFEKI